MLFGSFQHFLGPDRSAGGIKPRNKWGVRRTGTCLFPKNTTFGAQLSNAKKLFGKTDEDDHVCGMTRSPIRPTKQGDALDGSFLSMMSCSYLYLSGTLFRSLNNGEVHRGADFQLDTLRRTVGQANWKTKEHDGQPNPHAAPLRMIMPRIECWMTSNAS